MVGAAGTCLARAISRSCLDWGGLPSGPIAAIAPISLSFSFSMITSPYFSCGPPLRCSCLELFSLLAKGACTPIFIDAEQPGDLAQSLAVLRGHFTARAQHLPDEVERLEPLLTVGRKHRRDRGQRGFLIEQQHVELLAHERLEGRQGQVAMSPANA